MSEHGSPERSTEAKQAACLECRRSKVRCVRLPESSACKRCGNNNLDCVIPAYHVGRYKGVKNKRSGLEKAIFQVQEAVKKARTSRGGLKNEQAEALEKLLRDSTEEPQQPLLPDPILEPENRYSSIDRNSGNDEEIVVNNADNPLQLLAIASGIPDQHDIAPTPSSTAPRASPIQNVSVTAEDDYGFFNPVTSKFDDDQDDPLDLGLVSMHEARQLFNYFHANLSHTRWGLDETVHTIEFVRSRSSFLLTSILSVTALFIPNAASLSVRLNNHRTTLAYNVMSRSYRSVEVVLAFMICIPWMPPGLNWAADDQTCLYLSTAMNIAIDLSLHKIVIPTSTLRPHGVMEKIAKSDCIEAQRALVIDGHSDIDPISPLGKRYLRARERAWLALFTLDRGVCLARGRPWTVPTGPLIDTSDTWHVCDIADKNDGSMIAACVLRRDFGTLFSSIRNICDTHHFRFGEGASIVKLMREKVEGFFAQWHNTWSAQIRQSDGNIPPYVEILVSHGKLSVYCSVINHPTASADVKQFFRAAGLAAALDVLRVTVSNESKLHSMPNNSVIMVSFAACFVLGLSTTRHNGKIYIAPNVRQSIHRAADVLERIGNVTPHRKGAAVLFARHIKRIMKQRAATEDLAPVTSQNGVGVSSVDNFQSAAPAAAYTLQSSIDASGYTFPGFESMTDDQLLEFIQNSTSNNDVFNNEYRPDESLFMDWLDWPSVG